MRIVTIQKGELDQLEVQALKTLADDCQKCDSLFCQDCPFDLGNNECISNMALEILRKNKLV